MGKQCCVESDLEGGKSNSRETSKEVTATVQVREDGGLDQAVNCHEGEDRVGSVDI